MPPPKESRFFPSNCIFFLFTWKQYKVPVSLELVWKQKPDMNDTGEKNYTGGGGEAGERR